MIKVFKILRGFEGTKKVKKIVKKGGSYKRAGFEIVQETS